MMIRASRFLLASALLMSLAAAPAAAQTPVPPPPLYIKRTMHVAVFETMLHNTPHDGSPPLVYLKCGTPLTVLGVYGKGGWLAVAVLPGQMVKVVLPDGPHFVTAKQPIIGYLKRIMVSERVRCSNRDSGIVVTPPAR